MFLKAHGCAVTYVWHSLTLLCLKYKYPCVFLLASGFAKAHYLPPRLPTLDFPLGQVSFATARNVGQQDDFRAILYGILEQSPLRAANFVPMFLLSASCSHMTCGLSTEISTLKYQLWKASEGRLHCEIALVGWHFIHMWHFAPRKGKCVYDNTSRYSWLLIDICVSWVCLSHIILCDLVCSNSL